MYPSYTDNYTEIFLLTIGNSTNTNNNFNKNKKSTEFKVQQIDFLPNQKFDFFL